MSTGNRIILPNGTRQRKPRPDDPVTLDQALNLIMNSTGPISKLLMELVERQKQLEDHVGYVAPEPKFLAAARASVAEDVDEVSDWVPPVPIGTDSE